MIFPGEVVVKAALDAGLSLFAGDPSFYVSDIYSAFSSAEQAEVQSWLGKVTLSPAIGYPETNIQPPAILITTEAEEEIPGRQVIGSEAATVLGSSASSTPYQHLQTTYFRSVYSVHLLGPNQRQLLWLQMLVKWCLLMERVFMEQTFGLLNVALSATGLIPVEERVLRETPYNYERAVIVTGEHFDSYQLSPSSSLVTSTSVTLEPQSFNFVF